MSSAQESARIKPEPSDEAEKVNLWNLPKMKKRRGVKSEGEEPERMKRPKSEEDVKGEAGEASNRYARQPRAKRAKTEAEIQGATKERFGRNLIEPSQFANDVTLNRTDVIALLNMKENITSELKRLKNRDDPSTYDMRTLRKEVQQAAFLPINVRHAQKVIVPLNELIELGTPLVPEDIVLDATVLRDRFENGDFDTDPLRGIIKTQTRVPVLNADGVATSRKKKKTSQGLDKTYPFKKSANVSGSNGLVIGQCWPLQICALRDGAHGDMEAGISGSAEHGAYSVIISGGHKDPTKGYEDVDNGDVVLYCGTRGDKAPLDPDNPAPRPGVPSQRTKMMLRAEERGTEIRLLRSSKNKNSKYAPRQGIRYDGLYTVDRHETLDEEHAMYRFLLRRVPGQYPIRYEGEHIKPNDFECRQWDAEKDKWQGLV